VTKEYQKIIKRETQTFFKIQFDFGFSDIAIGTPTRNKRYEKLWVKSGIEDLQNLKEILREGPNREESSSTTISSPMRPGEISDIPLTQIINNISNWKNTHRRYLIPFHRLKSDFTDSTP
jgi:hypothetical protein